MAGISPDIICLSKSLSGYGLPLAIAMMKPELDVWSPGEHNGTFRGHNPAFVTATAALDTVWRNDELTQKVRRDAAQVRDVMFALAERYDGDVDVRGRGMIQGIEFEDKTLAGKVSRAAFRRGLIIETSGPNDEVLKALPPLTIDADGLQRGLEILERTVREVLEKTAKPTSSVAAGLTSAAVATTPNTSTAKAPTTEPAS
jgi:diaminobutyrate-2-oxoglutarate transaminase